MKMRSIFTVFGVRGIGVSETLLIGGWVDG